MKCNKKKLSPDVSMYRNAKSPQRAFTLIELLIVMGLIVLLGGLLLVTVGGARRAVERTETRAIIAQAQTAIASVAASSNVTFSPVPHPLAATAYFQASGGRTLPRAIFYRGASRLPEDEESLAVRFTDNNDNDTADWEEGMSLTDQRRVVLAGDRFAGYLNEGDVPHLFGLERRSLGVLSASAEWINQTRRLPAPIGLYADDSDPPRYITPIDDSNFPDEAHLSTHRLTRGETLESNSQRQFQFSLGPYLFQFAESGAIRSSPEPDTSEWFVTEEDGLTFKYDVKKPITGTYDPHNRVWIDDSVAPESTWSPGKLFLDDEFVPYQIRGSALIDAYGNEIIIGLGPDSTIIFMSAGADGTFMVNPGENGVIDTSITSYDPRDPSSLTVDDENGQVDNIGVQYEL
jgi:prepilin-type N-terminal cleavage/methylation domain-containing protein